MVSHQGLCYNIKKEWTKVIIALLSLKFYLKQTRRLHNMYNFLIGCNYWDSASGTDMWRNWNEDVIEKDLAALEQCGVKCLRVFPNWRDFQPVSRLSGRLGEFREYVSALDESPLEDNISGVDPEMLDRFRRFAQIAKSHNMVLMVAVVTGWMSGRLFLPQALQDRNVVTDGESLMLMNRFINRFITAVKDIDNIIMWDLGNECNHLGKVQTRGEAYTWAAFVRNAIRQADNTRLIASGMHGLSADQYGPWTIADQGELCDIMTTHPYPSPTINGNLEPYNGLRTSILPTAQSVYYSGISEKPCMIQEQGVFSLMNGNLDMAAQFVRVNILSAWANDLCGYLYWCGTEHIHVNKPPYTWIIMERQLGILDADGQPKPVGEAIASMQKVLNTIPALPPKQIDCVCVLPDGERQLKGTSSFILAQEAGFNISFRCNGTKIPVAPLYIVPGIEGWSVLYKRTLDFILDQVANCGASCLFTYKGGEFITIEEIFGLTSNGIRKSNKQHTAEFSFGPLNYFSEREVYFESVGAEVLARNEEGNVVFSRNPYGKGYIYFLGFPVENLACNATDGFDPDITQPYYQIYRTFAQEQIDSYVVQSTNPYIGITQHCNEDGSFYVTAINYSDKVCAPDFIVRNGWSVKILYGNMTEISACDGVIMLVKQHD